MDELLAARKLDETVELLRDGLRDGGGVLRCSPDCLKRLDKQLNAVFADRSPDAADYSSVEELIEMIGDQSIFIDGSTRDLEREIRQLADGHKTVVLARR
ncbi:MAG: hypothetical protein IH987_01485 [Planctomycetes bacterium]|nr:hypothetical protein [Planctomycetota bacterium]